MSKTIKKTEKAQIITQIAAIDELIPRDGNKPAKVRFVVPNKDNDGKIDYYENDEGDTCFHATVSDTVAKNFDCKSWDPMSLSFLTKKSKCGKYNNVTLTRNTRRVVCTPSMQLDAAKSFKDSIAETDEEVDEPSDDEE